MKIWVSFSLFLSKCPVSYLVIRIHGEVCAESSFWVDSRIQVKAPEFLPFEIKGKSPSLPGAPRKQDPLEASGRRVWGMLLEQGAFPGFTWRSKDFCKANSTF